MVKKIRELDDNERKIVRELIKDPRISDNQIGKNTKVSIMTVNRKRKRLEEDGILKYCTHLDTGKFGTGSFTARQLYMVKLKLGLTYKRFENDLKHETAITGRGAEHIFSSFLCEKDGHLVWCIVLRGGKRNEINEYFNSVLVPILKDKFGGDCINTIQTFRITNELRYFHNYLPGINMENGRLKKNWPNEMIFID